MKFEELDQRMRSFETVNDRSIMPEMYIVARIDGRGFTKLTKERHDFAKPFDERFHDYMIATVLHLMNCGFNIIYGYTQSDEISLLFHLQDQSFSRKERKLNSLLAGEASAKFSLLLGDVASFDCRICEFPNAAVVTDYFRWRNEDAHRNALSAHCYWLLRNSGLSAVAATNRIEGLSSADKNELLFSHGINYNDLPAWQKRGSGIYWREVTVAGYNPVLQQAVTTVRNKLFIDKVLPFKESYSEFIRGLISAS
ncbi:tRNA(His)-5'-guanylyltransferase [Chitinophaga jiangningensis]|uniref:tRNA(His) guanylyltransferase n=1 Tax=Chitinophaga jiangningensis TaxID=1419482 RepID=A0A1M7LWY3_9BACT|nr:tRNA(His) guanylyltransferase Thg1 family protein [Chitinophaga jiangningensis]SHM82675.1 tRNA(His)-5'-guanylyltransferase [Chitinophaga jiangningensis]